MQIDATRLTIANTARETQAGEALRSSQKPADETKKAFIDFVGQTMFGQSLASMRKTIEKPAYFHGGRAEEVFQGQLDQVLVEKLTDASAESFAGPMFEMFMMHRS